jgi:hypothetical protein
MIWMIRLVAVLALVCFAASPGLAQPSAPALTHVQVDALVRKAVDNEIHAAQDNSALFRYTLAKENNSGRSVREMVETADGIVARTISWNGRQLTPEERAKEDERLALLITSPEERQKKFKEQREDADRAMKMLRALPDALLYDFTGVERIRGRDAMRLHFTPNPSFSSSAKETYLFRAAEGHLWIDTVAKRIVKLEGVTRNDVNIGWGILGHIRKGGKMFLEQSLVGDNNQWRLTALNIEADGKVLFFRTLKLRQRQSASKFVPVTQMTIAAAVELLRKNDTPFAGTD